MCCYLTPTPKKERATNLDTFFLNTISQFLSNFCIYLAQAWLSLEINALITKLLSALIAVGTNFVKQTCIKLNTKQLCLFSNAFTFPDI